MMSFCHETEASKMKRSSSKCMTSTLAKTQTYSYVIGSKGAMHEALQLWPLYLIEGPSFTTSPNPKLWQDHYVSARAAVQCSHRCNSKQLLASTPMPLGIPSTQSTSVVFVVVAVVVLDVLVMEKVSACWWLGFRGWPGPLHQGVSACWIRPFHYKIELETAKIHFDNCILSVLKSCVHPFVMLGIPEVCEAKNNINFTL